MKVALVTGAAKGIGRAIATALARRDVRLFLVDQDAAGVQALGETLDPEALRVKTHVCDVAVAAQVEAAFEALGAAWGRVDLAFNNAGSFGVPATTRDCDEAAWRRVIDVNLTGTWLCMRRELSMMAAHGSGSIVNMASVAGLVGITDRPAYVASKHAIVGLTKAAALEHAKAGIRVCAVAPGFVDTDMSREAVRNDPTLLGYLAKQAPIARMLAPEEIADAAVWLALDAPAGLTGEVLVIDGGYLAR